MTSILATRFGKATTSQAMTTKPTLFRGREQNIFGSILERFSNLFNGKGFNSNNTLIHQEAERGGALAEYQAAIDSGITLSPVELANYNQLKTLEATRNKLLSKYLKDGKFDYAAMDRNAKDKALYIKTLTDEFNYERMHSERLVDQWKNEGLTNVPLTPYLKKIYGSDIEQFGNPFQNLDLDPVKLINGGLKHWWKAKVLPEGIIAALAPSKDTVYNFRPDTTDGLLNKQPQLKSNFAGYKLFANRSSNKSPGGFNQFDQNDIELLAHELTHCEGQTDEKAWEESLKIHNEKIKEAISKNPNFDYFEGAYGVSDKISYYLYKQIPINPNLFIGKSNELIIEKRDLKGNLIIGSDGKPLTSKLFTETRADIIRLIIHLKLNKLKEYGIIQ